MKRPYLFSSLSFWLSLLLLSSSVLHGSSQNECQVSQSTPHIIPDCTCRHDTVQHAVTSFISPLLGQIVPTTFFRYFFVELERPCPFWKESGVCMIEACSVCTCPDEEVPVAWVAPQTEGTSPAHPTSDESDFGWVSNTSSTFGFQGLGHDESLGKISLAENAGRVSKTLPVQHNHPRQGRAGAYGGYKAVNSAQKSSNFFEQLYQTEDCDNFDEWTELHAPLSEVGVYVNLLQNPERFTGYAGPSAQRVWRAIKEENCFGSGVEESCLEKRIFYRLMSGLQASISTHIARQYLHSDTGRWGINLPLYWNAVGNHPERVDNLYLAFLFLLRATMKAKHVLLHYPYETGNKTDDALVKELMGRLLGSGSGIGHDLSSPTSPLLYSYSSSSSSSSSDPSAVKQAVAECSYGFNEQSLFQVPEELKGPSYWQQLEEKQQLRDEFKLKFRNISRILDCVTCEKCRLWGKLQVLGLGTAIKILLSNEDELVIRQNIDLNPRYQHNGYAATHTSSTILNRQEVIALINTLHQFSKSVDFSAFANRERQREEQERAQQLLQQQREEEAKEKEKEKEEGKEKTKKGDQTLPSSTSSSTSSSSSSSSSTSSSTSASSSSPSASLSDSINNSESFTQTTPPTTRSSASSATEGDGLSDGLGRGPSSHSLFLSMGMGLGLLLLYLFLFK